MIPIYDMHTDYTLTLYPKGRTFGTKDQISYRKMVDANTRLLFCGFSYDDALKDSQTQLRHIEKEFNNNRKWMIVRRKKDIQDLENNPHSVGVIIHLEGGEILENNINNLVDLHKKGLRSLGLTWNNGNGIGTGCMGNPKVPLTKFGREVIAKCNALGIIVDLSHLNRQGFYDALDICEKPPVVTHANCYKLCPHQRNLTDSQMKVLAKVGGVMGIFFSSKYLNPKAEASIDDVIKHVLYAVDLVGVEHVAIGSDFGGITSGVPTDLENCSKLPSLLNKLKERGLSEDEIAKIAWGNAHRIIIQNLT